VESSWVSSVESDLRDWLIGFFLNDGVFCDEVVLTSCHVARSKLIRPLDDFHSVLVVILYKHVLSSSRLCNRSSVIREQYVARSAPPRSPSVSLHWFFAVLANHFGVYAHAFPLSVRSGLDVGSEGSVPESPLGEGFLCSVLQWLHQ
jgi:hypothetical protein